jgi:hypothetical protein
MPHTLHGKTGGSLTNAIIVYQVVGFAVALVLVLCFFIFAMRR